MIVEKMSDEYTYHSLAHTLEVVKDSAEIGRGCQLSEEEMEMLEIAAWFHDSGYTITYEDHERLGADMAREFLSAMQYPTAKIQLITECIMATSIPQSPDHIVASVLCDADLCHLGRTDYNEKASLLRKEWEITRDWQYTDSEWYEKTVEFFKSHNFHTNYAHEHFREQKWKNIREMEGWI